MKDEEQWWEGRSVEGEKKVDMMGIGEDEG
jgi:hypothetical protein